MRKFIPVVAAAALAGSGAFISIATLGGVASATKAPVPATCTSLTGDSTIAAATSGATLLSTLGGCSSTDTKVTADALDVSSLNAGSTSAGSGTIYFTNGKSTTYTYTVATTSGLSCPTFLGQTANDQELITITVTGGKAKVTAGGSMAVCAYVNGTDGTIHEANPTGSNVTI